MIFKNYNTVLAQVRPNRYIAHRRTYIQWLCPHWEEKKASLSFLPDKKASDGKKWEKAVRFFIVRPNRVGNQFYDDKPNGGCYMDWNENFSPVPQLQVHSVRILKIWSPWLWKSRIIFLPNTQKLALATKLLYNPPVDLHWFFEISISALISNWDKNSVIK